MFTINSLFILRKTVNYIFSLFCSWSMNSTLSDVSATAAVPVHVDMNPPVGQPEERNVIAEFAKAIGIIKRTKMTSPVISEVKRRLRECIGDCERSVVQEFEVALRQGGVSPGIVHHLASMFADITVHDIQMVLAGQGDSIVIYFLCNTVKGIYKLGQMITSGFMHAVFTVVIQTTEAHTTVDVYVRADEYNLRLLCVTAPQRKGQSIFRHRHLTSDSCVSPRHNTKVAHSSDTHTWSQTTVSYLNTTQRSITLQTHTLDLRLLCLTSPQHKGQSLFRHTHLTSDSCVSPHHNTKVGHSSDWHTWPQTLVSYLNTTQRLVTLQTQTLDLRLLCLTSPQHKCRSLFRLKQLTSDSCVSPHHNTKVCHSSDTHTW